jgi:16S rRNA (guanine527-N7)-methyltransferase
MEGALDAGANEIGFDLDQSQLERLWRYAHMLRERNAHVNLTAIVSWEGILTLHMLDSLTAGAASRRCGASRRRHRRRFSRHSAGRGLPERNSRSSTARRRRSASCPRAIAALDIRNARRLAARAENFTGRRDSTWSSARAVSRWPGCLHTPAETGWRRTGRLLAMKGRAPDDELRELPRGWHAEVTSCECPGSTPNATW